LTARVNPQHVAAIQGVVHTQPLDGGAGRVDFIPFLVWINHPRHGVGG
jgi:hypothetical protein